MPTETRTVDFFIRSARMPRQPLSNRSKHEKLSNRFRCCPPSKQQQQQSRTASTDSDAYSSGVTSETTSTKSKPKTYRVKPRSVMHHHASEPLPPHARKCCYGPGAGQDSEDPCCCTRCEYLWPQMYGSKCAPHSEPQIGATRSAAGTFSAPLKNHRSRRSSCFFIGNSANGGAGSAGNKDLHRATSNLDPRSRTPAAAYKRDIKTSAGSLDHHRHNQHNYHRDRRRGRRDGKRRSPRTETRADRDTEIEDEGAATSTGDEMKKRDQRTIDELLSSPETLKLLLARQLPAEHQLALEARIMQMSTMSRRIDAPSSSSSLLNKSYSRLPDLRLRAVAAHHLRLLLLRGGRGGGRGLVRGPELRRDRHRLRGHLRAAGVSVICMRAALRTLSFSFSHSGASYTGGLGSWEPRTRTRRGYKESSRAPPTLISLLAPIPAWLTRYSSPPAAQPYSSPRRRVKYSILDSQSYRDF
uniref:BESS domain-containing protein n=1 Tax=Trichogramma kaykai TaxID=54128 RepID=A0ABD2X8B7_9HYME